MSILSQESTTDTLTSVREENKRTTETLFHPASSSSRAYPAQRQRNHYSEVPKYGYLAILC